MISIIGAPKNIQASESTGPQQQITIPASSYMHSALSSASHEIRLLRLYYEDGAADTPRFELLTFSLEDAPPYFALSYTWASPERTEEQQPADEAKYLQLKDSFLEIQDNLYDFLNELHTRLQGVLPAKAAEYSTMWVDAVCINQQDIEERNEQVTIMHQIYSRAEMVLIWLGRDSSDDLPVLDPMMRKLNIMKKIIVQVAESDGASHEDAMQRYLSRCLVHLELPELHDPQWALLLRFFSRTWFQRVWIIQEVALARHGVQTWCGDRHLDWESIYDSATLLNSFLEFKIRSIKAVTGTQADFVSQFALFVINIQQWCLTGKMDWSHLEMYRALSGRQQYDNRYAAPLLLHVTLKFSSTDPRDKIFGVLGVLKRITGSERLLIDVDYSLHLSDVLTRVTAALLQQTGWLGLLCSRGIETEHRPVGLPSWALDVTQKHVNPLLSQEYQIFGKDTDVESNASPGFTITEKVLGLSGYRVASIDANPAVLADVVGSSGDIEELCEFLLSVPTEYAFTNEPRAEALWKTLVAHRDTSEAVRQSFRNWWIYVQLNNVQRALNSGTSVAQYVEATPKVQLLCQSDVTGLMPGHHIISLLMIQIATAGNQGVTSHFLHASSIFARHLSDFTSSRSLFRTVEGHIGLGHQTIQHGDEVWILPRCPNPVVLRRITLETAELPRYQLIGECYVHGIMYGEFFKNNTPVIADIEIV
jgi:hypothetical protein